VTTGLRSGFPVPTRDRQLGESLARRLEVVEQRLADAVTQTDELADSVSRHLVEAGGKRVRPMLTLLAAHLADADRPEVLDAAVVVELTHLATLYHDDVMDEAPLRRGAESANSRWTNTVAILTGDFLFARASEISTDLGTEVCRLLALGLIRLRARQSSQVSAAAGESSLHFPAAQGGHANPRRRRVA